MSGAYSTFNLNSFPEFRPEGIPSGPPPVYTSGPATISPLASAAQRSALDSLIQIAGDGSPAGSPAAPGSALDAGRGLGQIGGMVGSLAGGPLGSVAGRALGSGIGGMAAAGRAQEISDMFGLGQMTSPASAFGQNVANAALSGLAGIGGNVLGGMTGVPGLGSLAGRAVSGFTSDYDARGQLEAAFNDMISSQFNDEPDEMTGALTRGFWGQVDQPMSGVGSDLDFGSGYDFSSAPPSMDYYDSGMSGMGGETASGSGGYGGPGDNASAGYGGDNNYAGGGVVQLEGGGKVAVGPGGGLDDLIPTSINGRRAAALSDGEFVIPADVVSMFGDGSSNAGARRLYDLVRQVRNNKTGSTEQAGPLPVGDILKRALA